MENGEKITVSPSSGYDEDLVRLYLLGTCMGVLLMQRHTFPLHGSAIAIDGKAYAFIGDSGAGKSTLASAFMSSGFQLVSDDVIAVSLESGQPMVTPSYPQQKLWQESLDKFGMDNNDFRSIYGRQTKFCIPVTEQYYHGALPLAGVFELKKSKSEHIQIQPITGLERVSMLYIHTYRNFLLTQLGLMEWHFLTSTSIANKIDINRIERPLLGFTAHQLVSHILAMINKGV
jgi:hypothetical protein